MKTGNIVLIDDNKGELLLFKEAIKEAQINHPLVTFQDPLSALDYIITNVGNIFLIICDINMPRMTGLELLERLNSMDKLKLYCVPFVFFTNSSLPSDVNKAYELSVQGYFQKPFDMDELISIFKSIFKYWTYSYIPMRR